MIGGLQGEFGDLDIKYLKQNISKCRSGSFRRNFVALCKMETWSSVLSEFAFWLWAEMDPANHKCLTSQAIRRIWIVGRGCSPGKRNQRIWICLTGEVETPSSPIRRQAPDVKYPIRGSEHNSGCEISGEGGMLAGQNSSPCGMSYVVHRKGDHLRVQGVRTPPPDDTECASLSGAAPSGFPKRTRGALSYPDSLREKHTALVNITPQTIAYPIRICCLDHWLTWASLATAHVPPPSDGVSGRPVRTSLL